MCHAIKCMQGEVREHLMNCLPIVQDQQHGAILQAYQPSLSQTVSYLGKGSLPMGQLTIPVILKHASPLCKISSMEQFCRHTNPLCHRQFLILATVPCPWDNSQYQ